MLSKSEYVLPEDIIVLRRDNMVRFIWDGKVIGDAKHNPNMPEFMIQEKIDEFRVELADDLNEMLSRGIPVMPDAPEYLPDWLS